jgi:MFS family permease
MPYLSSVGIARSTATFVASAVPLISILGRLGSGWLGDRFDKRLVATGCFTVMGLGLLSFSFVSQEAIVLIFPFALFFGIGWGGITTIRAALLREYFGRSKFGSILGLTMGMVTVGTVVGPLFAGWVFDNQNSYHTAWLTFACIVFIALIIVITTPPVSKHIQSINNND